MGAVTKVEKRSQDPAGADPALGVATPALKQEAAAASTPAAGAALLGTQPARASAASIKELRRGRARRMVQRLFLFVALPTLLAAVYFALVASNQYQSYAVFTIHSAELRPSVGLESLLVGVGSATARDVLAVRDYVLSRDMLTRLDKEQGFVAHYQSKSVDWYSRLSRGASFEKAYEYFADKVAADFDTNTGSLTLRVRAFDPQKAVEISRAVLSYSEEMVNKLSERERSDRTRYAEQEVAKAEERFAKARQAITALQQKHKEFNPLETAGAALSLRTQLEGEVAKARADLMQLQSFMQEDAPQVQVARARVNSLAAQVSGESRRMVDSKEGGLNTSLPEFEAAAIDKEFAQKAYESAMAALEVSRSDAARQHRYLATIASPSVPDESTYPRRFLSTLTVFVVAFLIMGIGTLMVAAIREHARL